MENKYLCRHIQQERKRDMAKYVTIMDIARELGISKSTVSRALSGDTGNVKAETLQKILATAERMVRETSGFSSNTGVEILKRATSWMKIWSSE